MKKYRSRIPTIFLFCALAIAASGIAFVARERSKPFSVTDLPPIVLEKCIAVQKVIGRNPYSPVANDYLLVTKYEEKSDEAGAVNKGLIPGRALNIYLVRGLLASKNHAVGIVHDSILVVKLSTAGPEDENTLREWILTDDNGDRKIDRGVFREIVTGTEKGSIKSIEMAISKDRLGALQAYYDKAAMTLDAKAAKKPAESCVKT